VLGCGGGKIDKKNDDLAARSRVERCDASAYA
jgi:hypothetical protein